MAILTLRYLPDPILRAVMPPVQTVTPEIRRLVRDMIETMYAAAGVGLAANQVGQPWQLFVASPDQQRGHELVVLNPTIISRQGRVKLEEGCLSVPGMTALIPRAAVVRVRGMTLDSAPCLLEGREFLARILQHEIDHLNGKVYVDRLASLARYRLLRRYHQQRQELANIRL